jgi:Fic family protein
MRALTSSHLNSTEPESSTRLVRIVINRLLEGFEGNLNTSKYAKLAKCSTDTARRDINELLERSILDKNPGGGRSASYRLIEPAV